MKIIKKGSITDYKAYLSVFGLLVCLYKVKDWRDWSTIGGDAPILVKNKAKDNSRD